MIEGEMKQENQRSYKRSNNKLRYEITQDIATFRAFIEEVELLEARLGLFTFKEKEKHAVRLKEIGEGDSAVLFLLVF